MVLRDNVFIEAFLIDAEKENLSEADMAEYRRPFRNAGEDRRPMLTWPRQIPLDGSPADVAKIKSEFCDWLRGSAVPKLWVRANPGFISNGRVAAFCEGLENQTEVRVKGGHYLQESSGPEIGQAVADFVRKLRR
jgi:haloalkane dehalogenase